jgi:glutathione synthase/RimK-type ligase-like ATP-grasp enzyme
MILVLTRRNDGHAAHVCAMLAADPGAPAHVRFDPKELPGRAALSFALGAERGRTLKLTYDGGSLDLAAVSAIWFRRPQRPAPPTDLRDDQARSFVAEQSANFLADVYRCLEAHWFPAAPHVIAAASHRLYQLQLAARLGLEVPETIVTNTPSEVLAFYRAHAGRIASKPPTPSKGENGAAEFVSYNQLVTNRDLVHLHTVRTCPAVFQRYIEKKTELRVTVVDGEVFAAELSSQTTNRTKYDWRRYDQGRTPHRAVTLPAALADRCVAITAALGLRYGAIDLIRTPDDRHVFLEINPNGQYLWIERETGLPISRAICQALSRRRSEAT